jgi:hypothetical protein
LVPCHSVSARAKTRDSLKWKLQKKEPPYESLAELGLHRFSQTASDQPSALAGASFAASLGPTAVAEIPLSHRLLFLLKATAPTYFMRVEEPPAGGANRSLHTTYYVAAAIGAYL